jgi:hypothetical protein
MTPIRRAQTAIPQCSNQRLDQDFFSVNKNVAPHKNNIPRAARHHLGCKTE